MPALSEFYRSPRRCFPLSHSLSLSLSLHNRYMGPHSLSASHASNNARIVPVRDVVGSGGGLPRERSLQADTCSWMQGFVNYLLLTWQLQLNY